ncbi:MAG: cation-translocating P-type ATPase [Deltaproteobacteria bacterium]|nr:cation-translocating P-type ATPase [Deltaproteobacteria bacterium]
MSRVPPLPDDPHGTTCALCGLPVPRDGIRGEDAFAGNAYCCAGCAHVDRIVAGLPEPQRAATIKALAERLGIAPLRAASATMPQAEHRESPRPGSGQARAETQRRREGSEAGEAPAPKAPAGTMVRERFRVTGMHCPSCAWLAERLLESRPGVSGARVDYLTETASADIDLRRTSREDAFAALEPAGYRALPLGDDAGADPERTALRLAVAAIAAMNAMMLAWVHYVGLFGVSAGAPRVVLGALQALIVVPAVAWSAAPIFRRAGSQLRLAHLGMESLLALGILASAAVSFAAFALPDAEFYFELPAMIAASSLASRLVERRIRRSGVRRILDLVRPPPVHVRLDPQSLPLPPFTRVDELRPGDRVLVPAGDEVPADVAVVGGPVTVSEAVLTGEARPVVRRDGAVVLSGSRVVGGELRGEVVRSAAESAQSQLGRHVLDLLGGARDGPRLADRISAVFVPSIVLAALGAVLWHGLVAGHGLATAAAWLPAVAVLVVACPCAFSIAAAAALGAATLRLLRDGVLVGSPRALEAATDIHTVIFDKTGTLTAGDMDVREVRWFGEPEPALLHAVASLERSSRHPVGLALRRFLADAASCSPVAADVENVPGNGLRGTVAGRRIAVGAPGLFDPPPAWSPPAAGGTFVLFGDVTRPAGAFLLDDPVRPGAREAVAALRARRLDVELLSGDDPRVAAQVAAAAGIDRHEGRASPADKAARVAALRSAGHRVLYVGDGVNDAPALAAADVGLAMRHGEGMACQVAGFVAVADDPRAAPQVLAVARVLGRIVRQNYAWAVAYNLALLPLAAAGWLHPALAALAMFLSSITVLANSARLLRRRSPAG